MYLCAFDVLLAGAFRRPALALVIRPNDAQSHERVVAVVAVVAA